ncbi:hypothetical protein WJX72_004727 [[Myrmecia] bisecta]|uniref:Uncharacterized protein n=1 Tax=[Myrmecia] bisecta TaxID=41462 RepID=A0AAW1PSA3_9CHLO
MRETLNRRSPTTVETICCSQHSKLVLASLKNLSGQPATGKRWGCKETASLSLPGRSQRQLLLQYGAAAVRESADSALDLASSSSTSFGAPDNTEFQFWESASYDSGASGSAAYSEWEVWPEAPKEDWPSLPQPAPKPALLGWKPVRSSRVKRTNGVKVLNRASESFGYTYAGPVTCNEELEQQGYQRLMRDEGSWQAGPLLEAERQRQIAVAQQLHEREVLRHPTAADMHSMMDRASGRPTEADASDFVMSTCASSSGRQLMRQMMDAGWHPVFPSSGIGNSHPKWKRRLPNGTLQVITHSSSPSDVRAMAHLQAALARADRAAQEAHQEASPANC